MKKIILFFTLFILFNRVHAQTQLSISQAISYKVACYEKGILKDYWLNIFGKKVMEQEYTSAKNSNDEFKLNKIKKTLSDKYNEAIKSIQTATVYYVTELIDNYSYDFEKSAVKISFGQTNKPGYLDVYTEGGVRKNYMTKGLESDFNPEFRISNPNNIQTFFEMPERIAEKSFAQRKGDYRNRPAFKLRYYFKFWQCGSKFEKQNFGGYRCDVEVVKIELIDDIVSYKKAYDVEPGEKPFNIQDEPPVNTNEPKPELSEKITQSILTEISGTFNGISERTRSTIVINSDGSVSYKETNKTYNGITRTLKSEEQNDEKIKRKTKAKLNRDFSVASYTLVFIITVNDKTDELHYMVLKDSSSIVLWGGGDAFYQKQK